MAKNDTQKEIELLRQQLEMIQREREVEQGAKGSASEAEDLSATEQAAHDPESVFASNEASATLSEDSTEYIIEQFKELLNSIDKDIKETKPTTLLIVFALGVLVGRL